MEKKAFRRKIVVEKEVRKEIAEILECSLPLVALALNYQSYTSLSIAIRREAMRKGGKEYVLVPTESAWIEGGEFIEKYQTGEQVKLLSVKA